MAAPRPKPTALKLITGNPGKRALPKNEPKPDAPKQPPKPPAALSKAAKVVWRREAKHLHQLGLLTFVDYNVLAVYCENVVLARHATQMIETEGAVTEGSTGNPIQSPWVRIKFEAERQIMRAAVEFGMTPSSRTKVTANNSDEPGEFDGY